MSHILIPGIVAGLALISAAMITTRAQESAPNGWKYGAIQICPDGGGYAVSGMDSEASARSAVVQGAEIGHAKRGHGCKTDSGFYTMHLVGLHCERNKGITIEEDSYIGKGPIPDIARNDAYKQAREGKLAFADTECAVQITLDVYDDPKTKPPHWRVPVLR